MHTGRSPGMQPSNQLLQLWCYCMCRRQPLMLLHNCSLPFRTTPCYKHHILVQLLLHDQQHHGLVPSDDLRRRNTAATCKKKLRHDEGTGRAAYYSKDRSRLALAATCRPRMTTRSGTIDELLAQPKTLPALGRQLSLTHLQAGRLTGAALQALH